ncbi:succinate dehydrogenase, hydrophobic membrane anchor protein [Roseomonas harenae]|uniref:succinate dehydrogenase, hydrophobic membrane anchor protein n=1 Tax=Muricoccus harenae TaxID=2692566 RepID=UPI00133183B5|nr:succinate dehydrogenase, hydrophobic membrane anchor protein [Roseomonas harenae]
MTEHQSRLQTPLGRVRGAGSAKGGTHHWWMQRVTSLSLLPLMIWFAFSIAAKAGAPWEVMAEWIGRPVNAVLLIVLIAVGFYHTASGLQVVVEDYVRPERAVMLSNLAIKAVCVLLGLLAALSVLRLAI